MLLEPTVLRCWALLLPFISSLLAASGAFPDATDELKADAHVSLGRVAGSVPSHSRPERFPRPSGWRRCEEERLLLWPESCCCPEARPCFGPSRRATAVHGLSKSAAGSTWGSCGPCPGSFAVWREHHGALAEVLLASLLMAPRSTSLALYLLPGRSGLALLPCQAPVPGLGDGRGNEELDFGEWLVSSLPEAFVTVPQIAAAWRVADCAADSYWWALALVSALLAHFLAEVSLMLKLLAICFLHGDGRRLQAAERLLRSELHGCWTAAGLVLAVLGLSWLPGGAELAASCVNLLLAWRGCEAAVAPLWWLRVERPALGGAHLALAVGLAVRSQNRLFDWPTLLMLMGPGAWLGYNVVAYFLGSGLAGSTRLLSLNRGSLVVVERWRFLESSVEQLSQLGSRQLRHPPHVVYADGPAEAKEPTEEEASAPTSPNTASLPPPLAGREAGLDFGGMRRDWLGQLAAELCDPKHGLVELSTVEGAHFARLAPKKTEPLRPKREEAELRQFEVLGKVLGLALRDRQPLGIHICPPLGHLLVHPDLPTALDLIADYAAANGTLSTPGTSTPSSSNSIRTSQCSSDSNFSSSTTSSTSSNSCGTDSNNDNVNSISSNVFQSLEEPLRDDKEVGMTELRRMGFSGGWLRWVSQAEHDWAEAQARSAAGWAAGSEQPQNLAHYMESRALSSLVLDVSEELKAVWRGLRMVPGVPLPSLEEEVRGSKRLREEEAEAAENDRASKPPDAKRRRMERRVADGASSIDGGSLIQGLLSGGWDVPVEQWRALTSYSPALCAAVPGAGQQTVQWFWSYVDGLGPDGRASLLEWVTGFRRLPPGGFPPPLTMMTLHLVDTTVPRFPVAHTCGLQLDLPRNYASQEELARYLDEASLHRQFLLA
ncbi:unnamed protein product [Polarella glacialis]|uniref:HECT-type E3 ubiquitin transferase n=1 Tax=Polarella glacialis TaxID=89957 RepID=A0A813E5W8_POLGL|nr:unnamed protein product [Polarella glacialis]